MGLSGNLLLIGDLQYVDPEWASLSEIHGVKELKVGGLKSHQIYQELFHQAYLALEGIPYRIQRRLHQASRRGSFWQRGYHLPKQ